MKFICKDCGTSEPCIIDVIDGLESPYACPYANDGSDIEANWEKLSDSDCFEMRGLCTDCSNNCDNCNDASNFEQKSANKDKRGKILLKALDIINGERQDQYGSPEDSFALIAAYWTTFLKSRDLIQSKGNSHALKISAKEVAEMMMLFKIARMSGQKPKLDNYLDLVGYAGIAADMIEEESK
jgi:hypothetical protein